MAAADYGVNVIVLLAFAAAGTISYSVPFIVLGVAVILNIVFVGAIASRYSRRFADPSMTFYQVWAALGINIFALILAPQIAYVFIINLFVPLAYASLNFQSRTFFYTWLALSSLVCATFLTMGTGSELAPLSRPSEQALLLFVFTLVLARYLAINGEISRLRERLRNKNIELSELTTRLSEQATHDELTGLWNRRQVFAYLESERQRAERFGGQFCVAVLDADRFKEVNDTYGHGVGDEVLRRLSAIFSESMRGTDHVARYGGEEFVIVLVNTDVTARAALERVRLAVERYDWRQVAEGLGVTISIGFTIWKPGKPVALLLNEADKALYQAKHSGRNRVVFAADIPSGTTLASGSREDSTGTAGLPSGH